MSVYFVDIDKGEWSNSGGRYIRFFLDCLYCFDVLCKSLFLIYLKFLRFVRRFYFFRLLYSGKIAFFLRIGLGFFLSVEIFLLNIVNGIYKTKR